MAPYETKGAGRRVSTASRGVLCLLVGLLWASGLRAQSPEEHASHHPGQAVDAVPAAGAMPVSGAGPASVATPGAAPATGAMPAAGGSPAPGGMGGMGDMGEMMKGMGAPKPKDFYPTLMDLPDLPLPKRLEVEQQAGERMRSGVALMNESLDYLLQAASARDYTAMQASTASLREGLARFESGLAAQRALAEGKAPRNVALTWFKRDMNLLPLAGSDTKHTELGVFHWFVMVLLVGFFVVMIWMYFHKMRRATLLLQRLTGGAPPAVDAKAALPATPTAADARAAPPAADAKAALPAMQPAADAKAAPPATPPAADAKAAPSAAPPATDAKAVPPAVPPAADAPPTDKGSAPSVPAAGAPGKWSGKLRLSQIFEETPNVKTFRLMDPLGGEIPFSFQPGQYLIVTVLPEGKPVRRRYTIASSPTEHAYVDLTIKREDKGVESRYLHDRVQVSDLLEFAGPSGSFVFTGVECKCLAFIAAGVGIIPLMSVTRYLTDRSWPGEIFLLYSCHSPRDFIFKEELEYLQRRHSNLHVIATVSSAEGTDWKGPTGRITKEFIAQSVPDITSRRVHICGPAEMMEATEKFLAELGVPREQVKAEAFGPAIGQPEPDPEPTDSLAATPKAAAAAAPPAPTTAAPPAPATTEAPAAAPPAAAGVVAATVTFSRSAKTAPLPPDKSVLEVSEDIGVKIPFECRVGTCGACKAKLLSGQVTMAVEDALTSEDKAAGIILACQAKSVADCAVDA